MLTLRGTRSFILAAAAIACISASPQDAQAQWFTYRPPVIIDEMTPREVVNSVRRQGFNNPSLPQYRDDFAVLTAVEPGGRRVRLLVDIYSGRIVESRSIGHRSVQEQRRPSRQGEKREELVQRVPDQGATIRRSVPDSEQRTRATPERPSVIRREPLLPPQTLKKEVVPAPKPAQPQTAVGSGTRAEPRRIEMVPPAGLEGAPTAPKSAPSAPINSVPPAALE